jgi:hypothetical protein
VQKSIDNLVAAKNIRDKKMQEMKDKQAVATNLLAAQSA